MSVPAFVELAEILADLLRQADPLGDPLRDLAVAGENRNAHLQRFGETLLHGLAELLRRHVGEDAGEGADKGRGEFRMAAHVDEGEILAKGDLVAEG